MTLMFSTMFLFSFVIVACYYDIKYRKIFNFLTLPFLAIGILFSIYAGGIDGVIFSLQGVLTGFSILLLPFLGGWVGAGDVKFLAAAGSFLGSGSTLFSTFIGLVLFGVVAIIYICAKGKLFMFIRQMFVTVAHRKMVLSHYGDLPLGVFLGFGIIFYWLFIDPCLIKVG